MSRILFRKKKRFQNNSLQDLYLGKLTNTLMFDGEQSKVEKAFQHSFKTLLTLNNTKEDSLDLEDVTLLQKCSDTSLQVSLANSPQTYFNHSSLNFQLKEEASLLDVDETPSSFIRKTIVEIIPTLETRRKRMGRRFQGVPTLVKPDRGLTKAALWISSGVRNRQRTNSSIMFQQALLLELNDTFRKSGHASRERDVLHKTACLNRSNVRFR